MTRLSSEVPLPLGRTTAAKNATRIRNWIEKAQFLKQRKLLPDTFPGLDAPALLLNLLAQHQEFLDVPTETARKIFAQPKLQPWLQNFHKKTSFTLQQPLPNEHAPLPVPLSYLASEERTSYSYSIEWPQNNPIKLLTAQVQQHETLLFHLPTLQLQFASADTIPQSYSGLASFLRRLPILSATSLSSNQTFTAWVSQVYNTVQEKSPSVPSDLEIFMWALTNDPFRGNTSDPLRKPTHTLAYESIQAQLTDTHQLLHDIHYLELNIRAGGFDLTTKDSMPLARGALPVLFCNQKTAFPVKTVHLTHPLLPTPFQLNSQNFGQKILLSTSSTKTYTSSTATPSTPQEHGFSHHSLLTHLYNDYETAGNNSLSC